MNIHELYISAGGVLAPDHIPLHFGDQRAEYEAALHHAVLMNRSHEGRLQTSGRDRFEIINRISTNDVIHMADGEGRPTILTSPTGRIIDRLIVYKNGETAVVTTEPGRGQALRDYLQRQIFFNDDMRIHDLGETTQQFVLHGPNAEAIVKTLHAEAGGNDYLECKLVTIAGGEVIVLKRKPFVGSHWAIVVPNAQAVTVWQAIMEIGKAFGIKAAGSLAYNALRVKVGRPAAGRELTTDYIPLEAGLWDEVSFKKGCYTGQEIIARMESRNRLAKTMVTLSLGEPVDAPATLFSDGKEVGQLTSSVVTPEGEVLGIGFVKVALAEIGQTLTVGTQPTPGHILTLAGTLPPMLEKRDS